MSIFNTLMEVIFISLSFFMTGTCFSWLVFHHRLRIQGMDVGLYDFIERELPEYRRSVKARETGLVLMGIVITAANCAYISVRPSVFIACASMVAALLLIVVANRYFAFVKVVLLLSTYSHHEERLRQLIHNDERTEVHSRTDNR